MWRFSIYDGMLEDMGNAWVQLKRNVKVDVVGQVVSARGGPGKRINIARALRKLVSPFLHENHLVPSTGYSQWDYQSGSKGYLLRWVECV